MANISIAGGTSPSVAVYGKNLGVAAGIGADSVGSTNVSATVSATGINTLTLNDSIKSMHLPAAGNDTINLGSGSDTIVASGQASVASAFSNGVLDVNTLLGNTGATAGVTLANARTDLSGVAGGAKLDVATVIGGALDTAQVTTQNGRADLAGVFSGVKAYGNAIVGTAGVDTLTGGAGKNVFEFLGSDAGGQHTITNFVSSDKLYVEGYSLSYLQSHHDISTQGGNTYINLDGGKTTIELKGVSGLNSSELTTHKP